MYRQLFLIFAIIFLTNILSIASPKGHSRISGDSKAGADPTIPTFINSKTRVSQTEIVNFPKNGAVRVSAVETIGRHLVITFANPKTKRPMASFQIRTKSVDSYVPEDFRSLISAFLRFRVVNIKGLPSPLIHAVGVNPGGSDHGFLSVLLGEVNGKFKILTPEGLETAIQGGVHIGSLGEGRGEGIAGWCFIWDDREAHYDSHRYEVEFYTFDKKTGLFKKSLKLQSREKYDQDRKALGELKLSFFENFLDAIPKVREYREEN